MVLNKAGQNYPEIEKAITTKFSSYAKIATTTFVVVSNESTFAIATFLRNYIDNNDELFVTKITSDSSWCGMSKVLAWLQQNLNR